MSEYAGHSLIAISHVSHMFAEPSLLPLIHWFGLLSVGCHGRLKPLAITEHYIAAAIIGHYVNIQLALALTLVGYAGWLLLRRRLVTLRHWLIVRISAITLG